MNSSEKRRFIRDFRFEDCARGSQGFHRVLLQLFGFLGHGKSSFINTCKCVWEDRDYSNWAQADSGDRGRTMVRITYPLTDNIFLVDNRGFCFMDGYETGEIFAQLGNLLPLDTPVQWSKGFGVASKIVHSSNLVQTSDFIVPIFIYSVKKGIVPEEMDDMKELIENTRNITGIFPIVVLTHASHTKKRNVEATFRNLGIERIFGLENYTPEDRKKSVSRHEHVLTFLYEVIKDVQFKMEQSRDPEQEMLTRKRLVLRYIHHNDLNTHMQQLERENFNEQAELEKELQLLRETYRRRSQEEEKTFQEKMSQLEKLAFYNKQSKSSRK